MSSKIPEIIDKIKKGTPAKNFEDLHLDVKRYPESSREENQKKKLASLLKEYSVAFANSEGGALLLGIEDDIAGAKAITGCKNYDIEEMRKMVFEELIVLHHLSRNDKISTNEGSIILQRTQRETSEFLNSMEGFFIERIGSGRGTYYQLNNETLSSIGEKEKYTRIKGLSEEQKLQLLKIILKLMSELQMKRVICGVNRYQAARLLKKLVLEGLLIPQGTGRSAHYDINRSFK
ncbi:hypothetical protein METP1_00353 [Methanosarcinales archaeon]|nr:hypothetical protein METP1_00353 [Methanosarcinales archaeon]